MTKNMCDTNRDIPHHRNLCLSVFLSVFLFDSLSLSVSHCLSLSSLSLSLSHTHTQKHTHNSHTYTQTHRHTHNTHTFFHTHHHSCATLLVALVASVDNLNFLIRDSRLLGERLFTVPFGIVLPLLLLLTTPTRNCISTVFLTYH